MQFWQIRKASSRIQRSELVEYANKMITRRIRFDNKGRIRIIFMNNSLDMQLQMKNPDVLIGIQII